MSDPTDVASVQRSLIADGGGRVEVASAQRGVSVYVPGITDVAGVVRSLLVKAPGPVVSGISPDWRHVLPEILLEIEGSPWPLSDEGGDPGTAPVASFRVDRSLASSSLPEQARLGNGLSVGTAEVTVPHPEPRRRLSPWASTSTERVTGARPATLTAVYPDGETMPLGSWVVDPVSGDMTSAGVSIDLAEEQYVGKTATNFLPAQDGGPNLVSDPSWYLHHLAMRSGFNTAFPPAAWTTSTDEGMALHITNHGGSLPTVGELDPAQPIPYGISYVEPESHPGAVYALTPSLAYRTAQGVPSLSRTETTYLVLDVDAPIRGALEVVFPDAQVTVYLTRDDELMTPEQTLVGVQVGGGTAEARFVSSEGEPGMPNRYFFALTVVDGDVSARVGRDGLTWVDLPLATGPTPVPPVSGSERIQIHLTGTMSSLGTVSIGGPAVVESARTTLQNAHIDLMGGRMWYERLDSEVTAWDALQSITSAWLGAAWVTLDGTLMIRDRYFMAGFGREAEEVETARVFEDIPWTTDPRTVADRVVLSHRNIRLVGADTEGVWPEVASSDRVHVLAPRAFTYVDVPATRASSTPLAPPMAAWSGDPALGQRSAYGSNTSRDGSGSNVTPAYVSAEWRDSGTVRFTFYNQTTSPLYVVGPEGEPLLIARTQFAVDRSEVVTVEAGSSAADAKSTVEIDLGEHVWNSDDAQSLADFLLPRFQQQGWHCSELRTVLNWERDIGDLLYLTDEQEGLGVYAVVTGVSLSGDSGSVEQRISLTVLPGT